MSRSASGVLALSLAVALAGCGGDSTQPPAGLTYATNPATYTRGTAIPANAPTSTGGAVAAYAVTPALPAGLALHPTTGVLSGTPTAITAQATYTVTATNAGGSTTSSLSITVNDAPPTGLVYATNPAAYTKGTAIPANAPTNGGGAAVAYAVSPALPAGLSMNATTGVLSGTPTAITAQATHTVTATNTGGSTTAALVLTVNDVPPSGLAYATAVATYTVGTAIAPNVPASGGGAVLGYTVSPALPAGLSLDPTTGVVSGTPTAVAPSAIHLVTATNSGGSAEAALILRVNDVAPSELTYATNPATYTRGPNVTPNLPTYFGGVATAWSVTPSLPAGLSLNASNGILSGAPTAVTAQATYTVTATNSGGRTSVALVLAVVDPTLVSVAVTPSSGDVTAGGASVPLTARATYSDASTTDVTGQATWTTTAAGQVDVTGGGLASAPLAARVGGSATVTATFGGRQGSASLRVVRGPALGPLLGNDPLAEEQWYLVNTGQRAYSDSSGIAGEDLRLTNAMGLGLRGSGVKVAVVDTGLEIAHPDLSGNVVPGSWNFVDDTDDPSPSLDATGGDHGTSVSGIIGMRYDNAIGGMGVASGVGLNGYNFLQNQSTTTMTRSIGASSASPTSDDVWIFNQSFGTSAPFPVPALPAIEAQYLAGVTALRSGKGALYVKSAGNGFRSFGTAYCAPAQAIGVSCQNASMDGKNALPYNVVVGALDASGVRSGYSSAGSAIWVSAPGGEYGRNASVSPGYPAYVYEPAMVTTDRTSCDYGYAITGSATSAFNQGTSPNGLCDYTNTMNGTSSAAPATVGAIALLLDARPDLTWRDVKHILATTARQVDPDIAPVMVELSNGPYEAELPWTRNAAGRWFHNWYGFGAVDVDAAVEFARTYTASSLGAFVVGDWIASAAGLGLAIPDDSTTGASSTLHVASALTVESIQIEVTVTHAAPGDLGIELTSPSGSRSILLNIRNGFDPAAGLLMVAESNLFYGEPAAGDWTVKVVDGFAADAGTLDQWKIRIFGH